MDLSKFHEGGEALMSVVNTHSISSYWALRNSVCCDHHRRESLTFQVFPIQKQLRGLIFPYTWPWRLCTLLFCVWEKGILFYKNAIVLFTLFSNMLLIHKLTEMSPSLILGWFIRYFLFERPSLLGFFTAAKSTECKSLSAGALPCL